MTVRPGELDVDEFADLASQGEAELEMGNAAAAATALMQALALWGDPGLPDLPDTPAVNAAASALKAQRRAAADALIDARLAAGEYQQVIGELRTAALADPARERTCAQLMRAYTALGMRQEALAVYQRARQAMLEEQGSEPGAVLFSLQSRILAADTSSDPELGSSGAVTVGQTALPAWQAPAAPADFTGRSSELAELMQHLCGPGVPITVISGGPGAGKSALAAYAATKLREQFPDGQLFAELGGVESPRDPQDVLADILHGLGVRSGNVPPPGPGRAALYRTLVARRQVLVIADDAARAAQVRPLVPTAAGSAVLVTSRGRLSGLACARLVELDGLGEAEAMAVLGLVAGTRRVNADPGAAAAVVAACGGLPLALRLAGTVLTRRPGMAVADLAVALAGDQALNLLAAEDISVRAAIASSYRSLSAAAQVALTQVALTVPGQIPAWTLTSVPGGDSGAADEALATGLLAVTPDESNGLRYLMHPLTRAFAASQAPKPRGAGHASLSRLLAGWLSRADRAAVDLPALPFLPLSCLPPSLDGQVIDEHDPGRAWLDAERTNLHAAVRQRCAGAHVAAAALASRVAVSDCLMGRYGDAAQTWRAVAAAAGADADHLAEAQANYYAAAVVAEGHGDIDEVMQALERCLPVLHDAGNVSLAAMGQCLLARCASACGQNAVALDALQHAERLLTDSPEDGMTRCLMSAVRGLTAARMGMISAATGNCEQSVKHARLLGQPAYEAMAVRTMAQVHILGCDYPAAAEMCYEGIRISGGYGSQIGAARFLTLLGRARHCEKDPEGAVGPLLEAVETFRRAGSAVEQATAACLLAACRQDSGNESEAAAHLQDVIDVLEREGTRDASLRAIVAQTACAMPGA